MITLDLVQTIVFTYKQYKVSTVRTKCYGTSNIKSKSVNIWNYIIKRFLEKQLHTKQKGNSVHNLLPIIFLINQSIYFILHKSNLNIKSCLLSTNKF